MDNPSEEVLNQLAQHHIDYQLINHPPVYTAEAADKIYINCHFGHAKNLFLHDKYHFYLVTFHDDHQLDFRAIRKALHTSRLSFVSRDDLPKYLGIQSGAVSPLNLINDKNHNIIFVFDRNLIHNGLPLGCHPNDNTKTVVIPVDRLLKLVKEWGNPVQILDL